MSQMIVYAIPTVGKTTYKEGCVNTKCVDTDDSIERLFTFDKWFKMSEVERVLKEDEIFSDVKRQLTNDKNFIILTNLLPVAQRLHNVYRQAELAVFTRTSKSALACWVEREANDDRYKKPGDIVVPNWITTLDSFNLELVDRYGYLIHILPSKLYLTDVL